MDPRFLVPQANRRTTKRQRDRAPAFILRLFIVYLTFITVEKTELPPMKFEATFLGVNDHPVVISWQNRTNAQTLLV